MQGKLAVHAAAVLGFEQSQLDLEKPLTELGLDSMMAIELSHRIESDLSVTIPVAKFLQGNSVLQLTEYALSA